MNIYLITTCETFRADSESEAKKIIEEAKTNRLFTLIKYTNEYKERKLKGEVVDSYYKVTLTKSFNDIKEPETNIEITYDITGNFPEPEEDDDNEF